MRTSCVIASVARQCRRHSNGGSPTRVQPHRGCHVAMLLAMTDQGGTRDVPGLMRTSCVIASVVRQSRRRSNGGSPTCVQPHRDCHVASCVIASVVRQSRRRSNGGSPTCVQPHRDCHVAMLLAMTDQRGTRDVPGLMRTSCVIASVARQSRRRSNGGSPTRVQPHRGCHVAMLLAMTKRVRMRGQICFTIFEVSLII